MIDGLEISEVYFSGLNKEFRIDSEYYKKIFLADDLFLINKGSKTINCFVTDGQHGYHELDETSPIHMLTAKNTKMWFADILGADLIAKWVDENNKRSSLQENDLILSTRGSVGYCAIVKPDVLPANIDQDVARIKILDEKIFPEYLLTYLNCCFGQDWMKRNKTGMVQQGLSLQKVREIPVPILSRMFQNYIADIINLAYEKKTASIKCVEEAESLLINNIEINYNIQESISIKTLSESFNISGRLDAEYYQPKYEQIEDAIKKIPHATLNLLGDIESGEFISETLYGKEGYSYIRGTDITSHCIDLENATKVNTTINGLSIIEKGDLAFAMIGSVGNVSINRGETSIVSNNLGTIKPYNKQLANYLLVYLLSDIGQTLFEKYQTRTAQPKIKKEDVGKFLVPLLPGEEIEFISDKAEESFRLEEKSKELLDIAVKAVEMAIETDEEIAIAWLKGQGV